MIRFSWIMQASFLNAHTSMMAPRKNLASLLIIEQIIFLVPSALKCHPTRKISNNSTEVFQFNSENRYELIVFISDFDKKSLLVCEYTIFISSISSWNKCLRSKMPTFFNLFNFIHSLNTPRISNVANSHRMWHSHSKSN